MLALPLSLPYPGAASVCDATGRTVAECCDAATAAALVDLANAAHTLSSAKGYTFAEALRRLLAQVTEGGAPL